MNFLFILNTFYPNIGGVENATFEICKRLKEKSHNIYVLTTNKSNYYPNNKQLSFYEEKEGIHIYRVRFAFRLLELPMKGLYLAKKYQIDYCYVTDFWGGIALFLKKVFRIPFVYVLNGYNSICPRGILHYDQACRGFEVFKCLQKCHKISMRFYFTFLVIRLLISEAQPVIAVSNAVKNAHLAYIGDLPIKVLRYGIDSMKFHPKEIQPSSIQYGLNDNDKVILFFGRLIKERGVSEFLDQFKKLIKQQNYKLMIVGLGPEVLNIKSKIIALNLQDHIIFPGLLRDKELVKAINISEVVILPILFPEPLSLVALEAMACGKPVVSFKLGGIKELITDNKTGLLIPPHDWTQFISKLHELLKDNELRVSLGISARQIVEKEFHWNRFMDKFLQEIKSNEV